MARQTDIRILRESIPVIIGAVLRKNIIFSYSIYL